MSLVEARAKDKGNRQVAVQAPCKSHLSLEGRNRAVEQSSESDCGRRVQFDRVESALSAVLVTRTCLPLVRRALRMHFRA